MREIVAASKSGSGNNHFLWGRPFKRQKYVTVLSEHLHPCGCQAMTILIRRCQCRLAKYCAEFHTCCNQISRFPTMMGLRSARWRPACAHSKCKKEFMPSWKRDSPMSPWMNTCYGKKVPKTYISQKTGRQFSRRVGELSIGAFRRRKGTTQRTAPKHQRTHRGKCNESLGKEEKHVKKERKKKHLPHRTGFAGLGSTVGTISVAFSNP